METTNRNASNPDETKIPDNNSNNTQEYKSNEQIPSNDATPENLKAPVSKDANSEDVLHTDQKSQDNAQGEPKNNEESNPNIRNYLGSDKLNEKIASITKKYEQHKLRAEEILSKYTMGIIYE